jgi:hypothetical protein
LPQTTLQKLFEGKNDQQKLGAITILQAYVRGLLMGQDRPINRQNAKFQLFIGSNEHGQLLMTSLGFVYMDHDKFFYPLPNDDERESKLQRIVEELCIKEIENRRKVGAEIRDETIRFTDASEMICYKLGFPCKTPPYLPVSLPHYLQRVNVPAHIV